MLALDSDWSSKVKIDDKTVTDTSKVQPETHIITSAAFIEIIPLPDCKSNEWVESTPHLKKTCVDIFISQTFLQQVKTRTLKKERRHLSAVDKTQAT